MDYLTELLRTNDPFLETAIVAAAEIRLKSKEDLCQIEVAIELLKEKKNHIQKSIDACNAVLSPVRRLPIDILQEIFYQCLPTDHHPIMSATEAPMLLTRVSSLWRSVAFSMPRIWAKLHIPFPGDPAFTVGTGTLTDEMLAIRQHDFAKVIELRCQVVKEWLHRSGTCPLSISLHYPTSHNPALDDTNLPRRGADLGSNPLLLLVLSFSRRWKQVDLVLPPSVYDELEAHLSGDLLPILETFRLADCRGPRLRPMTGAGSLRPFMESPNLRRLCIDAMLLTRDIAMLPPTVWNRLTCLCIIQSISDVAFYDLIRHCHSLIHCEAQLKASQAYERRLSHRQTDIVSLIKVFKLDDLSSPVGILQSIYFPSLEFLDYRYTSSPFAVDFPPPFFLTIIKHAPTTFWKLNFAPRKLSSIHSIRGLHLASGITHLSLDCTPYLRVHTEDDMLMPEDCLDFSVFAINTTGGCKDILVPKLEVLEMYNVQRLTDETILRVLLSRIDAAQMGVVSPLRHVKIDIWRRRQKDIHEAVLEHAKSAGFEMKLELNYLPYRRVYHDRFSPSFLLASDNW